MYQIVCFHLKKTSFPTVHRLSVFVFKFANYFQRCILFVIKFEKSFSTFQIVCFRVCKKKNSGAFVLFSNLKMISQRCKNPTRYFLIVFSSLQNDIFRRCKQVALKVAQIIFIFSVLLNVFQPRQIVFTVARVSCAALQKFCYQGCK